MIKNLSASAGDMGFIPGLGKTHAGGTSNPLHYSCLGNPIDRSLEAAIQGVVKSLDRFEQLSMHTHML